MIGLSVSNCIRDIVEGKVMLADVQYIIGGTKIYNTADAIKVADIYKENYWSSDPDTAVGIFFNLYFYGKIVQPRVDGTPLPNILNGYWVDTTEDVEWVEEEVEK